MPVRVLVWMYAAFRRHVCLLFSMSITGSRITAPVSGHRKVDGTGAAAAAAAAGRGYSSSIMLRIALSPHGATEDRVARKRNCDGT